MISLFKREIRVLNPVWSRMNGAPRLTPSRSTATIIPPTGRLLMRRPDGRRAASLVDLRATGRVGLVDVGAARRVGLFDISAAERVGFLIFLPLFRARPSLQVFHEAPRRFLYLLHGEIRVQVFLAEWAAATEVRFLSLPHFAIGDGRHDEARGSVLIPHFQERGLVEVRAYRNHVPWLHRVHVFRSPSCHAAISNGNAPDASAE